MDLRNWKDGEMENCGRKRGKGIIRDSFVYRLDLGHL